MSKYRRPHGQYVRETADWFIDRRMAGGAYSGVVAGKFASVSLYNDATDGSVLHVIGATGNTFISPDTVDLYTHKGVLGTVVAGATTPITPFLTTLWGKIYTSSDAAATSDMGIWTLGLVNAPQPWPYNFPLCVLAPGFSLLCQGSTAGADVDMLFHWLVMGSAQGYY